jgi:hypothetical protein
MRRHDTFDHLLKEHIMATFKNALITQIWKSLRAVLLLKYVKFSLQCSCTEHSGDNKCT